jgi:uncharacterized repeat protein (TIGR04138 family)
MAELAFREGIMDRIRIREPRFDEQAYLFVLSALEMCQAQMSVRRHITGVELARAARDPRSTDLGSWPVVLEHWGISSTADIGDIVFTLVEMGLLLSQPQDTRDEFVDVFDFDLAFERDYPWNFAQQA